jgi:hypothetical protein
MGNATRGALATMDHADIRGLVTALRRCVAGLPRSSVRDHHGGCPHRSFEDSPHRVRASHCRSGVSAITSWPCSSLERVSHSAARRHVPADIPDEGKSRIASSRSSGIVTDSCVARPASPALSSAPRPWRPPYLRTAEPLGPPQRPRSRSSTCGSTHASVQPTVRREADRFLLTSTLSARLPTAGHDV